jgi:hypothetical protein
MEYIFLGCSLARLGMSVRLFWNNLVSDYVYPCAIIALFVVFFQMFIRYILFDIIYPGEIAKYEKFRENESLEPFWKAKVTIVFPGSKDLFIVYS